VTRSIADLLFRPRSVVVYGASSDPNKLSGRPLDYLKRFGYPGRVYAVNPARTEVQGVSAFPSMADVPRPVDLAIVVVPAEKVLGALYSCADHGVGAAIVFASGFVEAGPEGAALQDGITQLCARTGMRVLGPNCLGAFSVFDKTFATFSTAFDDDASQADSPIGLVTQSGAVGTFTYSSMNALGVGVRYFANSGNEADVGVVEILRALVDEPAVEVLLGHLEDGRNLAAVEELARAAAARDKPLVVLKGGRTPAGARAVHAHTGSVAGDNDSFEGALEQHGAIAVRGLEDWADTALALVGGRKPRGPRLTLVTLSGGCAAIAADAAVEAGLVVETWQSEDRQKIAVRLPGFASTLNPIDMTGSMLTDLESLAATLEVVRANDETDAICIVLGNADRGAADIVASLERAYLATDKPFLVSWTGGSGRPRLQLLRSGVPTYSDPGRAVRALARVTHAQMRRSAVRV
jgi:acyl-CoA synthetase (NDP forming)